MRKEYLDIIEETGQIARDFFETKGDIFEKVIEAAVGCLKKRGKILAFGNGGSASQAQHFASELVNKFLKVRPPIRAVALTTDTSALTSIGNDSSFDDVFCRQVEALGDRGDVALALSTSGDSANVIKGLKVAAEKGLVNVALTGKGGGRLSSFADFLLDVPSVNTPRIQEVHLLILHLLAREIECRLWG